MVCKKLVLCHLKLTIPSFLLTPPFLNVFFFLFTFFHFSPHSLIYLIASFILSFLFFSYHTFFYFLPFCLVPSISFWLMAVIIGTMTFFLSSYKNGGLNLFYIVKLASSLSYQNSRNLKRWIIRLPEVASKSSFYTKSLLNGWYNFSSTLAIFFKWVI